MKYLLVPFIIWVIISMIRHRDCYLDYYSPRDDLHSLRCKMATRDKLARLVARRSTYLKKKTGLGKLRRVK